MKENKDDNIVRMLAMGQYDAPQKQMQPIFRLDPYRSNIAVFGAPMSGKTTFIKTLLVRLHENMDQVPGENIYIIDFGGNIGAYGKLRNVCACFDNSNEENIKRVFRTIEKRLEENAKQLDSQNYYSVVSKTPEKAPTHLFLIIENVNAFLADERYASYQDRLTRFCRDGLTKGLTVVITANETSGVNRLLSNFGQKVAFEVSNESYYDIFNTKVNKPMKLPGRGIVNVNSETYEFQCFLPFPTTDDEESIKKLIEQTKKYPNKNILAAFSGDLTWDNIEEYCTREQLDQCSDDQVIVGLDYYEHKPIVVDIEKSRAIAIYGKRNFGITNLVSVLLKGIKKSRPDARFIYLDDGRKKLEKFYKPGSYHISDDAVYFLEADNLKEYLVENGYILPNTDASRQLPQSLDAPFTVFVIRSRMVFKGSTGMGVKLLKNSFPSMIGDAVARRLMFIFADVPSISEHDTQRIFSDNMDTAFLLDNIGEFMADKSDKTPFGTMDAMQLKADYAKCAVGDGYFYNVASDDLQKLKFVKVVE